MKRVFATGSVLTAILFAVVRLASAQSQSNNLQDAFKNPPDSAKPRVWWHWMNGNITQAGIKLDLEWMKRSGIAGFQNFDASLGTPKLVDKRLVYMTPEWKDAFRYATALADQLGLEEAIAGSPGWSESGGPWVKPNQGMKKFVWSETIVEGGRAFHGVLTKPPSVSGPFQDVPIFDLLAVMGGQQPKAPPQFYADTAVIAYKLPANEAPLDQLHAKLTSSGGNVDGAILADGDLTKTTSLPKAPAGQRAWIQFEFPKPQAVRAVTFAKGGFGSSLEDIFGGGLPGPDLESSDDGQIFRKIATVPGDGAAEHTISFPTVAARYFRVSFTAPQLAPAGMEMDADFGELGNQKLSTEYNIAELKLLSNPRVNRFEEKAAFAAVPDLYAFATPSVTSAEATPKSEIVDLTARMSADGTLDWTPPSGRWTILRFGYSLTGVTNHPASPEGTGLEVDKLNHDDVKLYMETYLDNYKSAVEPLMGKRGLRYVINDSWEAGTQNWTDDMFAEFTKRRGYDPRPWMPVLTGRIVENSQASDQFLWDFRLTLSDLLAENHYDQITQMLHDRGMGHYGESHESGRAFIGDGMEVKRTNDVPMSAMWTQKPGVNKELYGYDADIRESASVAHIYGQNLVAAESMTASSGAWAWSPWTLKPTADKEMAMGLNRFVIHTSVHQPLLDRQPGISLGPFGQWFTRNETWAEIAKPWTAYLARSCYLLQQGTFVGDVAYFYGEDSNITAIYADHFPGVPTGYNYDYINADALIHQLSFSDGKLVTPSGMSYRVLSLDPRSQHMSLPVLRKIRDLVVAGATVVGSKPTDTPSLADDQNEFNAIVAQIWGGTGTGKVDTRNLGDVLGSLNVEPDFEYTKLRPDSEVLFVHRKLRDSDLYYVDSRQDRAQQIEATFRVTGKEAELWHADTGAVEPASYRIVGDRTTVPLSLAPWETVFVVFRNATSATSRTLPGRTEQRLTTIEGPWEVAFQPDRGAPPKIMLDRLTSWSENADAGVKYFSGTGTYTKTLEASRNWFTPGNRVWIDLGDVANLAEVSVNGTPLGVVWKKPYRVDATDALKPGSNQLEIKVTDLWRNRIIGDHQPTATMKYSFTSPAFYKADSPLIPSGLLGPVEIIAESQVK
jgi:hypothetical protein